MVQLCCNAKELIATDEWQRVGPNDTLPAGLEIRMDLNGGGKWARLIPPEQQQQQQEGAEAHNNNIHNKKRCGPDCQERQRKRRREAGLFLRGGDIRDEETRSGNKREQLLLPRVVVMGLVVIGNLIALVVLRTLNHHLKRAIRGGLHES